MKWNRLASLVLFAIFCAVPVFGDAAPATELSTQPATQAAPVAATDKEALLKLVGSTATVTGDVSRTNWYNDSILFVNFTGTKRGDFTVIVRKDNRAALDKAFDGDVAKALKGKKITVTGKVIKYRESPEIEVTSPDQITISKE